MLKSQKNNKTDLTVSQQFDERKDEENKKEMQNNQNATFFHNVKTNGYLTIFYILV